MTSKIDAAREAAVAALMALHPDASATTRANAAIDAYLALRYPASVIHVLQQRVRDHEERIENAKQAMSETHASWESRCHAIMAALGIDYGRMDEFLPDDDQSAHALTTKKGK